MTDGHHGHELLDDGRCRLQDAKREVFKVFFCLFFTCLVFLNKKQ